MIGTRRRTSPRSSRSTGTGPRACRLAGARPRPDRRRRSGGSPPSGRGRTRSRRSLEAAPERLVRSPTTGAATGRWPRPDTRRARGSGRVPRFSNSGWLQPTRRRPAAAAAEAVERRELLGEDRGVAVGDDDHARAEADAVVLRADPGQAQDRLVDAAVVVRVLLGDEQVVGGPDRRPAESLGNVRGRLHPLARGAITEVRETESVSMVGC